MNKVILMGRLTRDAEIRNADSDKKVARCSIAVNRSFKREGDEVQADFLERFGKKGTKFIVIGRIQTGSYDKDGTKVYTTDVVAEQLEFAESKNAAGGEGGEADSGDGFTDIPDDFEGMPFN